MEYDETISHWGINNPNAQSLIRAINNETLIGKTIKERSTPWYSPTQLLSSYYDGFPRLFYQGRTEDLKKKYSAFLIDQATRIKGLPLTATERDALKKFSLTQSFNINKGRKRNLDQAIASSIGIVPLWGGTTGMIQKPLIKIGSKLIPSPIRNNLKSLGGKIPGKVKNVSNTTGAFVRDIPPDFIFGTALNEFVKINNPSSEIGDFVANSDGPTIALRDYLKTLPDGGKSLTNKQLKQLHNSLYISYLQNQGVNNPNLLMPDSEAFRRMGIDLNQPKHLSGFNFKIMSDQGHVFFRNYWNNMKLKHGFDPDETFEEYYRRAKGVDPDVIKYRYRISKNNNKGQQLLS